MEAVLESASAERRLGGRAWAGLGACEEFRENAKFGQWRWSCHSERSEESKSLAGEILRSLRLPQDDVGCFFLAAFFVGVGCSGASCLAICWNSVSFVSQSFDSSAAFSGFFLIRLFVSERSLARL